MAICLTKPRINRVSGAPSGASHEPPPKRGSAEAGVVLLTSDSDQGLAP